jgi:hypothetical protein
MRFETHHLITTSHSPANGRHSRSARSLTRSSYSPFHTMTTSWCEKHKLPVSRVRSICEFPIPAAYQGSQAS